MAERPSIYIHFEMGVSWRPRHPRDPETRQLTYMSKSARDRASQFPRQLPPSNTNYLAEPPAQSQATVVGHPSNQNSWDTYQVQPTYGGGCPQPSASALPRQPTRPEEDRRSRPQSRSSHGRGRSAPPPLSGSPWDEPEPMTATALPRRSEQPQLWKALPPTPAQFRLGHDDLPWSASPFTGNTPADNARQTSARTHINHTSATEQQGSGSDVDDRERVRTKEMQSLATAMMTVDNGFEDQWWHQGPRLVHFAGDLMTPAAMAERYASGSRGSWSAAVVEPLYTGTAAGGRNTMDSPARSLVDIVSPLSDFSSQGSAYRPLKRTLSTRSDELFVSGS